MIIKITKDKLEHEVVDTAIKQQVTLIPIGEGHYWAGSSNEWNAPDNLPSNKVKKELVQKINNILSVDYEIIEHKAAIRPTVKDRRPILGEVLPNIYIFNGLGTKGASLGPYWARCLVAHLLDGESINQEVNVNRFFKK